MASYMRGLSPVVMGIEPNWGEGSILVTKH